MSGWKKIREMINSKNLGEVKYTELTNYLKTEGFILEEGSKHTKVMTQKKVYLAGIPRQRTIRVDQLRYILRQVGRL